MLPSARANSGHFGRGIRRATRAMPLPSARKAAKIATNPTQNHSAMRRASDDRMARPASRAPSTAVAMIRRRLGQPACSATSSRNNTVARTCSARPSGHSMNTRATSRPYTLATAKLSGRTAKSSLIGRASPKAALAITGNR